MNAVITNGVRTHIAAGRSRRATEATRWTPQETAIYLLVIGLTLVRFFTERVPVLPRVLNAFDIVAVPVLLILTLLYIAIRKRQSLSGRPMPRLVMSFLGAWAVSWAVNADDVHWIAGFLLPAGLLTPILLYIAVMNLDMPPSFSRRMLLVLYILLACNLVIGTVQALAGFGSGEPDVVFGTFGVNIDQFAFFLCIMLTYFLAVWLYAERTRWVGLFVVGWTVTLMLVASFQTLWVVFPACALITMLRGRRISARLIPGGAVVATIAVLGWPLVPQARFDVIAKLQEAVDDFEQLGKVELVKNVPAVWAYRPSSVLVGVGPGTFNSRAFRSIAIIPYLEHATGVPVTDVSASIMEPFYSSDVADRFIIPYFLRGFYRLSGANTDGPFTSFVSIPIELGVPAAIVFFSIYGLVLRNLDRSLRQSTDQRQKVLAAWAHMSILMLLGLSVIDNSLEVTRYTILAWIPAVVSFAYSQHGPTPSPAKPAIRSRWRTAVIGRV